MMIAVACSSQPKTGKELIEDNFQFATRQLTFSFSEIQTALSEEPEKSRERRERSHSGPLTNPRTIEPDGKLRLVISRDWTSGFYPGELWYMYEYTGDHQWMEQARHYTGLIEREKLNGGTHDMGFKMFCSFGNGYRLTNDDNYREILIQSARTLTSRYREKVGAIRSWDHNRDKWQYPVIIDNMMNLELLFWAFEETGDSLFYQIAVNHARTTMKNHFRADYSTYHVIDYDTISGQVLNKHTHQGLAHESAWSRGQAWGLYGYTMCYRATGLTEFLEQAKRIENYMFSHPNMPEDLVPYWDFDAPDIPHEPRDASAASVTASALYELSGYVPEKTDEYRAKADKILESLSSPAYRSPLNENRGFLLMHSTGSKPGKSEIDVPLVYADYYFLEALLRKKLLLEQEQL
ncbi:MAG: glycoside hydrolase family 88 protein [Bacteroidales bacterium]|nr:glycoside hydrolase family 88 protein [Bacteroidales bacterium]